MTEIRLDPPRTVGLLLPREYAKACDGDPVRILGETAEGLLVRWDDSWIEFVSAGGGVSIRRGAVRRIVVDRERRVFVVSFLEIGVELDACRLPLLVANPEDLPDFEIAVARLRAVSPIPLEDPGGAGR